MKPNLAYYVQTISNLVTKTEEVGETMNPYYEEVRTAIDTDKLAELKEEQLKEVHSKFEEGTTQYKEILGTINELKAPAKVMGVHMKLKKAYENYVQVCSDMMNSIDLENKNVHIEEFNESEKQQDEATDTIAFCIQRMTSILNVK